jgi:hypothetical protein
MSGRGAYRKKQLNIDNVHARHQLLAESLKNPAQASAVLISTLTSQRSFADLSLRGTPIQAIALNTLKSIADEILEHQAPEGKGFRYLDTLRLALKMQAIQPPAVRSVEAQRRRRKHAFDELREALRLTEVVNLNRSHAYADLLSKLVGLLKATSLDDVTRLRLQNLVDSHKDQYGTLLSRAGETPQKPLRVIPGGIA